MPQGFCAAKLAGGETNTGKNARATKNTLLPASTRWVMRRGDAGASKAPPGTIWWVPEKRRDESRRGRHECPRHVLYANEVPDCEPADCTSSDRAGDVRCTVNAPHTDFLFALAGLRDVVGGLHPHQRVHLHAKSFLDA